MIKKNIVLCYVLFPFDNQLKVINSHSFIEVPRVLQFNQLTLLDISGKDTLELNCPTTVVTIEL